MLALSAASTVMGAVATKKQGDLAMETARHNAESLRVQNRIDADNSLESMARQRIENSRVMAALRSRMGSSGIDRTQGSSADFLEEARARMELSVLEQARSSELRARARDNQAEETLYQGRVAQSNAKAASTAHLLQGGARIAGRAYGIGQASKPGEFAQNAFGLRPGKWF